MFNYFKFIYQFYYFTNLLYHYLFSINKFTKNILLNLSFLSNNYKSIIKYQLLKSSNLFLFTIKSKNYYSTLSFFYFNKSNLQIKNK